MRCIACNSRLSETEMRRKNFDDLCGRCITASQDNHTTFKDAQLAVITTYYYSDGLTRPTRSE